ncbi:MAG: hypothetical protein ACJ8LG_03770 [Massilia sp.]
MIPIQPELAPEHRECGKCKSSQALEFGIAFAYQPIVDIETRSIFAHEALVRGPNGEGAGWVLSQVTDDNRYQFDDPAAWD